MESHASNASLSLPSEPDIDLTEVTEKKHVSSGFVGVYPPNLVHPKSLYVGYEPPLPRAKETPVLKEVLVRDKLFFFARKLIQEIGNRDR